MPDESKLEHDIRRLSIDFERATPLAEWDYKEVVFATGGQLVTIKHKIRNKGTIIFLAAHWRLDPAATFVPQLYTIIGEQYQFDGYIKVRSTGPGQATVLVGLRRDS
jgi:hypothetical protein